VSGHSPRQPPACRMAGRSLPLLRQDILCLFDHVLCVITVCIQQGCGAANKPFIPICSGQRRGSRNRKKLPDDPHIPAVLVRWQSVAESLSKSRAVVGSEVEHPKPFVCGAQFPARFLQPIGQRRKTGAGCQLIPLLRPLDDRVRIVRVVRRSGDLLDEMRHSAAEKVGAAPIALLMGSRRVVAIPLFE